MAFYQHKAIDEWPRKRVTGKKSQFDSKWSATLEVLQRELKHMRGVRWATVTLKTFHRADQVRNDGMLRADVTQPSYPGVILEFDVAEMVKRNGEWETVSRKMQFICDTYNQWKDNVRAIALGMEALRSVERYGITSEKGEQYEGFKEKALPPSIVLGQSMTFADAQAFIIHKGGGVSGSIDNAQQLDAMFRQAAARCHPDRGGNHEDMSKLNLAREVLKAHYSK